MPSTVRAPIEIRKEILRVIHDGVSVATRIAFKVGINNERIKNELKHLLQQECIMCLEGTSSNRRNYHMTEKGIELLNVLIEATRARKQMYNK